MAKTDGVARIIALAALGKDGGGSTGGTTNYLELANKPKINDVELTGNKTLEDLGINIPDLENYYTKEEINNTFPTTEAVDKTFEASWKETKEYIDASQKALIWDGSTGDEAIALFQGWLDKYLNLRIVTPIVLKRTTYREFALTDWNYDMYDGKLYFMFAEHSYGDIKEQINYVDMYCQLDSTKKTITYINSSGMSAVLPIFRYNKNLPYQKYMALLTTNTDPYTPTSDYNPATKKYVDDNIKTYTAGDNITISDDNVISASVSGGTDSNAVYTYYAPYSDEDWFTEENVANILQTVKDKGYSNFELCTLNGSHYALRKGGNLQTLTTTEDYYELEYLQNDLKNYVYYAFVAHLDDNNKIVAEELGTQTYTAQEMVETYLPETLEKLSGYDNSKTHLILQANAGNIEWDSSLDGGVFGDSYTDPTYYTEKQVDKIVTDTVNEVLGGKY